MWSRTAEYSKGGEMEKRGLQVKVSEIREHEVLNWLMKVRPRYGADGKYNGVTWDVFLQREVGCRRRSL